MNWWKKLFKESTGNTKVTPLDEESPKDYSDKLIPYDNDALDEAAPVVVTEDGTVTSALDHEEPMITVEEDPPLPNKKPIEPLDLMKVNYQASPNKSKRASGETPLYIVLHHTGPGSFNGVVKWLCNKDAKASAHYVLGAAAQLTQLVNTGKQAWHAGRAKWGDKLKNNSHSIGIEICNIGLMEKGADGALYYEQGRSLKKYTGKVTPQACQIVYPSGKVVEGYAVPYPEKQINKLVALCKALIKKYPAITRDNIITHHQVATPEGRKNDPAGLDVEALKDMIFG